MAIKYLENPIKCPFCQDNIKLEKEQLETLESLGDHGFLAVSPTCGSTVEIRAANTLLYDRDGLIHHANTRVYWNRVEIDRPDEAQGKPANAVRDQENPEWDVPSADPARDKE